MEKQKITNIASVGIIYRGRNPGEMFMEVKDDDHPIKLVRRQLCFIGGNWIGAGAKNDRGPLDTFRRELQEEFSFKRPIRTSVELKLLGLAETETFAPFPEPTQPVSDRDRHQLEELKTAICEGCAPFGAFANTVTKAAMDAADPENTRESFTTLACYWAAPLAESWWRILKDLQNKFNNLSNESITLLTSLDEILAHGTRTAFGHDYVLRQFFLAMGLSEAKKLPLVNNIASLHMGTALASYEEYLGHYDITRKP